MTPTLAKTSATPPGTVEKNGQAFSWPSWEQATPEERKKWQQTFMQIFVENRDYVESQWDALLEAHPEWRGLNIAVSYRTPSKILAVHECSGTLFALAGQSTELHNLAHEMNMPPDYLYSVHLLGDPYLDT